MSNKLNWLDSFAESQAKKMNRTASLNKQAEQIIVDPEEVPGATEGTEVTYKNKKYTVVDAAYNDEIGKGVVLEAAVEDEKEVKAALEDVPVEEELPIEEVPVEEAPIENDPAMTMTMGNPTPSIPAGSMGAQEYSRTNPGDAYSIGDVRDEVEVQKFQGEAAETEQQIAQENSVDRTVPEGKYSTNRIINRIVDSVMPELPVEEEIPAEEELPVEEEIPAEEEMVEPAEVVEEEEPETEEEVEEEEKKESITANKILNRILSSK